MALMLLASFAEGVGDRLASLRLQDAEEGGMVRLFPAGLLAAGALVALGSRPLAPEHGWGCVALAGTTLAFAVGAADRRSAGARRPARRWLAEHKGLAWLLLPFAVVRACGGPG